jgi:hypothetical protein
MQGATGCEINFWEQPGLVYWRKFRPGYETELMMFFDFNVRHRN